MKRNLTPRETRLALAAGVALLLGVTLMVVRGRVDRLRELRQRAEAAELESIRQQGMLERRPDLIRRLQEVHGQLPRHAEGRDLKPEFARQVQTLAAQSGLELTGLTPEPEEPMPELDLYESSLRGSWSGSSDKLVEFLVRLQEQGAVSDIGDLRVRRRGRDGASLSGTFTIDFVYARIPASEWEAGIDTPPQSTNDGASE